MATPAFEDLFIFEVANNHQGSVEHGLDIVHAMGRIARTHGIHAGVKFQYRNLDTFIHPDYQNREDVKHIPRFLSTRLTNTQFLTLLNAVRDEGMTTIVTPFDEASVKSCLDHGVQILKVASCSAMDWPLLDAIAAAKKPTIVSTGGLTVYDIDKVVSFLSHRDLKFALMHCVSIYPTPNENLQLDFVERLAKRYPGVAIGYSGHEAPDNFDPVKIAVAKGAAILERHVGVPTDTITLNKYSMAPEQVDTWVTSALAAKAICGGNGLDKRITQAEIDALQSLKRGVFAARAIKKGEEIEAQSVFFAMPCADKQLDSGQFGQYRIQWIASKDYAKNEPIFEYHEPDLITTVRSIVHDAKGMLYEANIQIGDDFEIELSHHYGLEHFRQTGTILITLVNREYCKKLVVMLPGQQHPLHRHERKEETFQLLWGDLEITLDDEVRYLKPGDKVLVERSVWHDFRSSGGAIFEEVSTRHYRGDSYYQDEAIMALDPMERKTVLEDW
ncbi:MAG: N-acetylneuraminate synthase family protein [Anaerolineales bacterium]|nr:N-acetylneuraminate synthase family protein [Anaerolineales bacterium]